MMASLEENRASDDRQIALRLGGHDELLTRSQSTPSPLELTEDILNQLSALNIIEDRDGDLFNFAQEGESFRDVLSGDVAKEGD
jgi:hypothetical protein